ncbi:MAG TPA: quinone-dependent dihydroorotate dehydrogenase [Propionicimonas sp.]|jgi:dihydroorotate dehydrogenase|uniref:quinone-dependent dihydroorotate dehydrogenase n=1 Tax=Propionicimonas sp. TaxID=1955623 RepID=UPI002F403059
MGLPAPLLHAGYSRLVRPALFSSFGGDPEAVHEWMIHTLAGVGSTAPARAAARLFAGSRGRATTVAGVRFPSRVGLAAGLDKDATAVLAWAGLGFGFAELGTVTGRAQPGNDRPRMFRLRESEALINRMGFNNPGAAAVAATLAARNVYRGNGAAGIPIGISIGKTKVVALEDAVEDYLTSLRLLAPHADYIAVNVSSPNTPGLRSLQDAGALAELLAALVAEAAALATPSPPRASLDAEDLPLGAGPGREGWSSPTEPVPVFVKVAPDLTDGQLDEVVATCEGGGAAGLIATNTTLARDGLAAADAARAAQAGGLSGAPLTLRARAVVAHLAARSSLPVIGSGGIMTPADATAMFDAGAELVQLYTGFIYGGPGLAAAINALDSERLGS